MATIECTLCGEKSEASFYDFWNCSGCGVDYGIRLHEYAPEEMAELMLFFGTIRSSRSLGSCGSVLALMQTFEKPEDVKAVSSCIDTLLLFFDSIVVPDLTSEELARSLGDKKIEVYRQHGLLKCSDNSFVEARAYGAEGTPKLDGLYDLNLVFDALPEDAKARHSHSRFELLHCLLNLEHVILNELLDILHETNLFNSHRIGQTATVRLRRRDYLDTELAYIIPMRFLRNEVFCHFFSYSMLYDQHYGIANVLKRTRFVRGWTEGESEFGLFQQWMRTTPFAPRTLDPSQVLECRATHGSLTDFVSAIQKEVVAGSERLLGSGQAQAFGEELEKRIAHYRKVKSKGHERKAIYLAGLFSTIGSLMGGPMGAVVGGIGGTLAANLALEFDRRISGSIGFVADEFVGS